MEIVMVMKENDNVAVCLSERKAGEVVEVGLSGETLRITLLDDIPFAHKFSLTGIHTGEKVIKYGEVIGMAVLFCRRFGVGPIDSLRLGAASRFGLLDVTSQFAVSDTFFPQSILPYYLCLKQRLPQLFGRQPVAEVTSTG